MSVTLDGQALFDEQDLNLRVGDDSRASIERRVPGLDGVLSIDLGRQARTIRQSGTLRAASRTAMRSRINAITGFLDGDIHTLVTADGETYAGLRMDAFKELRTHACGPGIVLEYEIVYTQLVV